MVSLDMKSNDTSTGGVGNDPNPRDGFYMVVGELLNSIYRSVCLHVTLDARWVAIRWLYV